MVTLRLALDGTHIYGFYAVPDGDIGPVKACWQGSVKNACI